MANKEVIFKLNIDGGSSLNVIKQIQAELGKLNNEFAKTNTGAQLDTRIAALNKSLGELKSNGGGESLFALRQEIKLIDLELSKLPKNTIEYSNQLKKLAERKADLADLRTAINALDPEKKVEAIAKVGTAIVGGYTAALGVTNLLGESNEELEKSLVKVQSALGVLSGLQAIVNAKDDLKILAVATGFDKLKIAILGSGAAGEGANVSFKALRATLATLGIGAIVAGIGLLIANWDKVKEAISGVSKEQKELNSIRDASISSVAKERESINQLVKEYSNAETTDKRRKQIKEELISASPTYFGILNQEKTTVEQLSTAYKNWADAVLLKAENDELIKKISEQRVKVLEVENSSVNDNVNILEQGVNLLLSFGNAAVFAGKNIETGIKNQQEEIKTASDNISILQKQLEENQKKLENTGGDPKAKDNSKKEAEDKLKQIEEAFKKEIELIERGENEKKTALLNSKPSEEELNSGNFTIDLDSLNQTIAIYKKYGKDISDLLLSRSQLEYEAEKKAGEEKIKLIEENKKREAEAKKQFETNTDTEYQQDLDNLKTYLGQRQLEIASSNLSESEKDRQLTALKKFELENRLQINKDYNKSVQSSNDELTQFEIGESEKRNNVIKSNTLAIIESVDILMQATLDIIGESTSNKFDAQRQAVDDFVEEANAKLDANSEQEKLRLEIQLAQGLISQTQFKQKELELSKKTEAEKNKIEAEANKKKRKFDYDEAVAKRKIAIADIAINIAVAVAKELESKGTLGFAFIAPLLAQGIASAAIVLSQPLPALAKGGLVGSTTSNGYATTNNSSDSTINNYDSITNEEANRILNSYNNSESNSSEINNSTAGNLTNNNSNSELNSIISNSNSSLTNNNSELNSNSELTAGNLTNNNSELNSSLINNNSGINNNSNSELTNNNSASELNSSLINNNSNSELNSAINSSELTTNNSDLSAGNLTNNNSTSELNSQTINNSGINNNSNSELTTRNLTINNSELTNNNSELNQTSLLNNITNDNSELTTRNLTSSLINNSGFDTKINSESITQNFVNSVLNNSQKEEKESIYKKYFINSYKRGGTIIQQGTTGTADDVLIRISKGESVINAAATRKYKPLLSAINQSTGGRAFASGGIPLPGSNLNSNSEIMEIDSAEQIELLKQVRDLLTIPNRSYVLETDITSSQKQIQKIEKRTEI